MENTLQRIVAWKFRTKAEYRDNTERLVYTAIDRFADLVEPIMNPIDKGLDKILAWYNGR